MIPTILHHVWPGNDPFRPELHAWRQGWLRHHPDWTMLFWRRELLDDETAETLGPDRLDAATLRRRTRAVLAHPDLGVVVKSDVLRWYALAVFGGVYADTDMECLGPVDDLLATPEGAFAGLEMDRVSLSPAFVGAAPDHPTAVAMLELALQAVEDRVATPAGLSEINLRPHQITGPSLFSAAVKARALPLRVLDFDATDWRELDARHARPAPRYARHHWTGCREPWGWYVQAKAGRPNLGHAPDAVLGGLPPAISIPPDNGPPLQAMVTLGATSAYPRALPTFPQDPPPAGNGTPKATGPLGDPIPAAPFPVAYGEPGLASTGIPIEALHPPTEPAPPPAEPSPAVAIPGAVRTTSPGRIPVFGDPADGTTKFRRSVTPPPMPPTPGSSHPQHAIASHREGVAAAAAQRGLPIPPTAAPAPPAPPPAPRTATGTPAEIAAEVAAGSASTDPRYAPFAAWYAPRGPQSGPGSSFAYTARFRPWLVQFLRDRRVESVVDWGCGDWEWAQHIPWKALGVRYTGLDVVAAVVEKARALHGDPGHVEFMLATPAALEALPPADLVICKDVLQHLPIAEIQDLLRRLSRKARFGLWINDRHGAGDNAEIARGDYRSLDLARPPFRLPGATVFEFGHQPDRKIAFLTDGSLDPR